MKPVTAKSWYYVNDRWVIVCSNSYRRLAMKQNKIAVTPDCATCANETAQ